MRYLSVCSGIEAATVAWHPLGWHPIAFAETAPFPSAILAHRWPGVRNLGDFTQIEARHTGPVDVLVGGTPCQAFSIAGFRRGLADARGNLALEFLRVAQRIKPRWIVWENVPGVLSSNGGRDFGTFLGALAELGYGFAYRVLDAQYFGLAQRRKRVFLIGYLGDWRPPVAVLFEPEGLQGDPPPRRKQGKDVAPTIAAHPTGGGGLGTDFDLDGGLIAHALRAEGFDAREDGTGRGTPLVPVLQGAMNPCFAIQERAVSENPNSGPNGVGVQADIAYTLEARSQVQAVAFGGPSSLAFDCKASGRNGFGIGEIAPTLRAMQHGESHQNGGGQLAVALTTGVRRLSPRECERLMGVPDDYTLVPLPLKSRQSRVRWAADGPRYKALGNSFAVPVVRWIGERIQQVEWLGFRKDATKKTAIEWKK